MNLYHKELDFYIQFEENRGNVLVLENPALFSSIVRGLWCQTNGQEGIFSLSDGDKEEKISKEVDLVFNPFSLKVNNKKVISYLYKELDDVVQNQFWEQKELLNTEIIAFLEQVAEKIAYRINYELQLSITELMKVYNVRIEEENETLLDSVIDYIKIMSGFCGIRLFVFLNLRQYFYEEEIAELYKVAFYEKINLLDIECTGKSFMAFEKVIVLDKDGCIIEF